MPDVTAEDKKSLKEKVDDNPKTVFLIFVVGVIWSIWFGIT